MTVNRLLIIFQNGRKNSGKLNPICQLQEGVKLKYYPDIVKQIWVEKITYQEFLNRLWDRVFVFMLDYQIIQ